MLNTIVRPNRKLDYIESKDNSYSIEMSVTILSRSSVDLKLLSILDKANQEYEEGKVNSEEELMEILKKK